MYHISCIIYHISYIVYRISYVISYHISYHIISYIISYHIISYIIYRISYIVYRMSYHIISYHIILYHISYIIYHISYIIYHIISHQKIILYFILFLSVILFKCIIFYILPDNNWWKTERMRPKVCYAFFHNLTSMIPTLKYTTHGYLQIIALALEILNLASMQN